MGWAEAYPTVASACAGLLAAIYDEGHNEAARDAQAVVKARVGARRERSRNSDAPESRPLSASSPDPKWPPRSWLCSQPGRRTRSTMRGVAAYRRHQPG